MIPKYNEIMLPLLKLIADGKTYPMKEIRKTLAKQFNLTEDELGELIPSGQRTVLQSRVGWSRTYLKKAGLLTYPQPAHLKITDAGLALLNENPEFLDMKFLKRYDSFKEFATPKKSTSDATSIQEPELDDSSDQTPEEILEYAYQKLNTGLSNELLDTIKSCSPAFFERLVVDILIAMGYGGSRKEAGRAVGKSNDGGIDGIINEDRLGLDVIYIQAKRWENTVPIREIRDFTGALASKRAKKGVFITTSDFPANAHEFIQQVDYNIILINGAQLADLMIEHNVGLSTTNSYHVKTIDTDYFEEN